jgi:uncharacterized membrane protein YphA (DoxX/SURF4 family)
MSSRVTTPLLWALRIALGALFVVTGVLKLGDPTAFAVEIHNYQLFPGLAPVLAATLPAVELVVGAAILVGPRAWSSRRRWAPRSCAASTSAAAASARARVR